MVWYGMVWYMIIFISQKGHTQTEDWCGSKPTTEHINYLTQLANATPGSSLGSNTSQVSTFNLRFIVVTKDDGTFDGLNGIPNFNDALLSSIVAKVNTNFSGSNITFNYCGREVINNSNLTNISGRYPTLFSTAYYPNAINVYIVSNLQSGVLGISPIGGGGSSSVNWIGLIANNFIDSNANDRVLTHELGHFFGLLHTFHNNNELVNGSNCLSAGDLICDTPADRWMQAGCSNTVSASCLYTGNCRDQNNVIIQPSVNNFMSYYRAVCRTAFTPQQKMTMKLNELNYISIKNLANIPCGSAAPVISDRVEFEGTNKGLGTRLDYTAVFLDASNNLVRGGNLTASNNAGNFKFIRYPNEVKYVCGGGNIIRYSGDVLDGLSTLDLTLMQMHILNTQPLTTGYQKIAADVNGNGAINVFDVVTLNKVLLGVEPKFPSFQFPYRLIPEYIPLDFTTAFNNDPFNIPNKPYSNYMLVEPPVTYDPFDLNIQIPIGATGKNGFDAIKIGDLNASNSMASPFNNNVESRSRITFTTDDIRCIRQGEKKWIYVIGIPDDEIVAYQLGFTYNTDKIKVLDIKDDAYNEQDDIWGLNEEAAREGYLKTLWVDKKVTARRFNGKKWLSVRIEALKDICDLRQIFDSNIEQLVTTFWNKDLLEVGGAIRISTNGNGNTANSGGNNEETFIVNSFPNPTSEELNITISTTHQASALIVITDRFNQLLKQEVELLDGNNQISLDISSLSTGVIFYNIYMMDGKQYSGRLIKL